MPFSHTAHTLLHMTEHLEAHAMPTKSNAHIKVIEMHARRIYTVNIYTPIHLYHDYL